jgi:hypothetical protein
MRQVSMFRLFLLVVGAIALAEGGCGGKSVNVLSIDGATKSDAPVSTGGAALGGSSGSGGKQGSGGAGGGGTTGVGGNSGSATGGSAGAGTGGSTGVGGITTSGTGGNAAAGGAGGAATGGSFAGSGGTGAGGRSGTGGTPGTGGTSASGGTIGTGGTRATGGASTTGGNPGTGGSIATGGASGSGDASAGVACTDDAGSGFAAVARQCTQDSDCAVYIAQSCCGASRALGIAKAQENAYAGCFALPAGGCGQLGCPTGFGYVTDTGKTTPYLGSATQPLDEVSVACVGHQCTTDVVVPPDAGQDGA